jgi:hypothetical protein
MMLNQLWRLLFLASTADTHFATTFASHRWSSLSPCRRFTPPLMIISATNQGSCEANDDSQGCRGAPSPVSNPRRLYHSSNGTSAHWRSNQMFGACFDLESRHRGHARRHDGRKWALVLHMVYQNPDGQATARPLGASMLVLQ